MCLCEILRQYGDVRPLNKQSHLQEEAEIICS